VIALKVIWKPKERRPLPKKSISNHRNVGQRIRVVSSGAISPLQIITQIKAKFTQIPARHMRSSRSIVFISGWNSAELAELSKRGGRRACSEPAAWLRSKRFLTRVGEGWLGIRPGQQTAIGACSYCLATLWVRVKAKLAGIAYEYWHKFPAGHGCQYPVIGPCVDAV